MADKEGLVAQFMAITGVDTERATFYLESAEWNLDVRWVSVAIAIAMASPWQRYSIS